MKYPVPVPRWKRILNSVLRHAILFLIMVIIVGALIWLTRYLQIGAYIDYVFPDS